MSFKSESPCVSCGMNDVDSVCYHHIYTQKAWPEFKHSKFNLMPLCQRCHNEVHAIGMVSFAIKRPGAKIFLDMNSWFYIEHLGKWVHMEDR